MMNADQAREAIAALRRQAEAKRHEADLLDAEARGMERLFNLFLQNGEASAARKATVERPRPAEVAGTGSTTVAPRAGGKPPGTLSNKWKGNLLFLHKARGTFTPEDAAQVVAERERRPVKPSEVRRLFRDYLGYGHIKQVGPDRFSVPEEVAAKFEVALGTRGDWPQTNEAPDAMSDQDTSRASITEPEGLSSQPEA